MTIADLANAYEEYTTYSMGADIREALGLFKEECAKYALEKIIESGCLADDKSQRTRTLLLSRIEEACNKENRKPQTIEEMFSTKGLLATMYKLALKSVRNSYIPALEGQLPAKAVEQINKLANYAAEHYIGKNGNVTPEFCFAMYEKLTEGGLRLDDTQKARYMELMGRYDA